MGYFTCKGNCNDILTVSRRTKVRKRCDPCNYYTVTEVTYCPCCGKKYKIRKTGQNKRKVDRMA